VGGFSIIPFFLSDISAQNTLLSGLSFDLTDQILLRKIVHSCLEIEFGKLLVNPDKINSHDLEFFRKFIKVVLDVVKSDGRSVLLIGHF